MHITEEQAKTKWCPLYRVATSGGDESTYEMDNRPRDGIPPPEGSAKDVPFTPGKTINPWACCIGSACMAWRWHIKPDTTLDIKSGREFAVDGYGSCGLAGGL